MSDYFLNKVYRDLLTNKAPKIKSKFRTLSESYNLVYEQDAVSTQTNPLTSQPQVTTSLPQQQTSQPTSAPITKFDQNRSQDTNWTPDQQKLYSLGLDKGSEYYIEGMGPGEYAVASVATGITDPNQLKKYISGSGLSYDVSVGESKFEVKKLGEKGSVRVGVEGTGIGQSVIADITKILTGIKEEYNMLNDEDKKIVNGSIISKLKGLEMPAKQTYTAPGGKKAQTKKYIEYLKDVGRREKWSVSGFVDSILGNITELPPALLFEPGYQYKNVRDEQKASERVLSRYRFGLMSVADLINYIDSLAGTDVPESEDAKTSDSLKALKQVFKDYYGKTDKEKERLHQELDKEAEATDQRIIKKKCQITGETCTSSANFFKDVQRQNFKQQLENIKQKIQNPNEVVKLFPITGVFFVRETGYKYVPKNELGNFIEIERFSSGGKPKIRYKI